MDTQNRIVSFDEDLILVNENDEVIRPEKKSVCHDGKGLLHRAFSVFLFDQNNEILLQKRSSKKRCWPLIWSNTCCSHPRYGEDIKEAIHRRLDEELGVRSDLTYLFKFQYQAHFNDIGSEHELCSVFIGRIEDTPKPNQNEISDYKFISIEELSRELRIFPEKYTPWLKIEWQKICRDHGDDLKKFLEL